MRTTTRFLPFLAALAVSLTACGTSAGPETTPDLASTSGRDAADAEPSGADAELTDGAAYDCREIDGEEICDTFGESDEGPGTEEVPAEVPTEADGPEPREVAEPDEGPGTDGGPGARRDCRVIDGSEVCDTFGESDEGPGTYDDRDEGPGTTS